MNKMITLERMNWRKALRKQAPLIILMLPAIVHIILFAYWPMFGLQIAFKDFRATLGIWGSHWVGVKHFIRFINYPNFWAIVRNTLSISLYSLATFPIPIIFALMINEIQNSRRKKAVQLITYAPHFISTVVICSMVILFLQPKTGMLSNALVAIGGEQTNLLTKAPLFSSIYVWSDVWQHTGWNMIIYLATLSSVQMECVEAAKIDGATRLQIMRHVYLPHILPTAVIMLILSVGRILNVGYEKILLLQNPLNLSQSTVISTYIYEIGLIGGQYSYSTAIGLFNTVVSLILVILVNMIARRINETSIW